MGFLANTIRSLFPENKAQPAAAMLANFDIGRDQPTPFSYERNAREGYMLDELVYDCVEFRADSAGEPPMCAYQKTSSGEEKITEHPAIDLLQRPNPFMGRSRFWSTLMMHLDIGGNAYIEKVRAGSGKVVELWLLRPDRMSVRPDPRTYVGGYTYKIGTQERFLDAEDVIHLKTRHPLDDYYGLPPLHVLAGRVDLDVWSRKFTEAFFRNAGVPAGMINMQSMLTPQQRDDHRRQFREIYGGPNGWHKVLLLDGGQATYTPMGLPLGSSGTAMPELNQILETRILGVFGVPASLITTMAGQGSSSYANRVSDRKLFWEETMVPIFRDLDDSLSLGLQDEFPDLLRIEHDLAKVQALQEDVDSRHTRWREDWKAGLVTWAEARQEIGLPEEPDESGVVLIPTVMVPTPSDQLVELDEPLPPPDAVTPIAPSGGAPAPVANGRTNGAAH
jgi:HK97 family phage portal protein